MKKESGKVTVIVVDDSALIRAVLTQVINSDPRLTVVATAADPFEAREAIKKYTPDVITLDIEMPKMNGILFLKNLMRLRPMPVVMISTLTQQGAPATLEALELGAIDFLGKPNSQDNAALQEYATVINEKIYWASKAKLNPTVTQLNAQRIPQSGVNLKKEFICAIGASTGGTEAIKAILQQLPENAPPIVLAQHIPELFSASYAKRLDGLCAMTVHEASHNQLIERGHAYLAPGHSHLRVVKAGDKYVCKLDQTEPVNRHRPSVEVLYDSVTKAAGALAMGVILTGMGADGAQALLRMKMAGAMTVAQDEATSLVWGMAGTAVHLDAANKVLPLEHIAKSILAAAKG